MVELEGGICIYNPFFVVFLVACKVESAAVDVSVSSSTVTLPFGSFQGQTSGNIDKFLGMPFAAPPTGKLRFAHPTPPLSFSGTRQATSYGAACPQQAFSAVPLPPISSPPGPTNISEDCLFINVIRPTGIQPGRNLPVVFWIYGGGFETGDSSQMPGDSVVKRSIDLQVPIIHVSANYRMNAFGFLGGKEVKAAGIGNAGLQDQRFALQWVQDHIFTFGGDPTKVTIWGESAGSVSVSFQMLMNDGNTGGLFRGGFMESGFPNSMPDILGTPQKYFDQLVADTKCATAADKLQCLRGVTTAQLTAAVNRSPDIFSYQSLSQAWRPMVDGKVLVRDPLISLQQGKYAKIPIVTGDEEDEGTLFSFSTLNITYIPNISDADLRAVELAYPDDITQGSPFNSAKANAVTPEFKRIAAFQGDWAFQAPRRYFLGIASKTQPAWAFRFMRGASTAKLGAYHSSDLNEFYGLGSNPDFIGTDAVIYFTNNGNPKAPATSKSILAKVTWNTWSSSVNNPPLLTFIDGAAPGLSLTTDTYRQSAMQLLNRLALTDIGRGS